MNTHINRLHIALEKLKRNLDIDMGKFSKSSITKSQFFLLYLIEREGTCKLTRLAEILEVTPSAITVMIDRLEKPGYIKRKLDPNDRRSTIVKLTSLGKQELNSVIQVRDTIFQTYISKLTNEEVLLLTELIEKMADLGNQ